VDHDVILLKREDLEDLQTCADGYLKGKSQASEQNLATEKGG
jgi:hypothetical protein